MVGISSLVDDISALEDSAVGNGITCGTCNEIRIFYD